MSLEAQKPIKFYTQGQEYYELMNTYHSPFTLNGKTYPTNEHYFQSQKFVGTPHEDAIIQAKTPFEAFDLGQSREYPLRKDWQQVKDAVMYEGLVGKFTQNGSLKKLLLETGERELIEHTTNDSYWADGGDGSGQNKLGKLLMRLRGQLK